jgi:hypothetical protein
VLTPLTNGNVKKSMSKSDVFLKTIKLDQSIIVTNKCS